MRTGGSTPSVAIKTNREQQMPDLKSEIKGESNRYYVEFSVDGYAPCRTSAGDLESAYRAMTGLERANKYGIIDGITYVSSIVGEHVKFNVASDADITPYIRIPLVRAISRHGHSVELPTGLYHWNTVGDLRNLIINEFAGALTSIPTFDADLDYTMVNWCRRIMLTIVSGRHEHYIATVRAFRIYYNLPSDGSQDPDCLKKHIEFAKLVISNVKKQPIIYKLPLYSIEDSSNCMAVFRLYKIELDTKATIIELGYNSAIDGPVSLPKLHDKLRVRYAQIHEELGLLGEMFTRIQDLNKDLPIPVELVKAL